MINFKDIAKNLYRETSIEGLRKMLQNTNIGLDPTGIDALSELYMSPSKDLAIGQGTNKGVMLNFRPDKMQGFVPNSLQNNIFKHSGSTMPAEVIAKYNKAPTYFKELHSFEILPNARGSKVDNIWTKRILEQWLRDGKNKYINPYNYYNNSPTVLQSTDDIMNSISSLGTGLSGDILNRVSKASRILGKLSTPTMIYQGLSQPISYEPQYPYMRNGNYTINGGISN